MARRSLSSDWVLGLILLLAVMLTYVPLWWAGYIWDDHQFVAANPAIVGPLGLKEIWTTKAADICPLTLTTFWVEHQLWGLAPLPYHLVNIVMHAANAVLLWRVLLALRVPGAWLGAALWALHPVQVESVAWITEMKNTQSGLFFLLSILFYLKGLRDSTNRKRWDWNYTLTLLFAALAMASKSSTVILPIILCLCAWWIEGRWQWRRLAKVAPIFLMSIAAGLVSLWTQNLQLANTTDAHWMRPWPERIAVAGDAIWFYLGKLLWPHPLIAMYPQWEINAASWVSYLPLLTAIVVLFILWLKRESWSRGWFFVFAYFLVALLPALGLLDNYIFRYSPVFDHFQYLAGMGPLAFAAAGIVRLADVILPEKPLLHSILGAGILLSLGIGSWQRSAVFENEETLWIDTLAKNPGCWAAENNLGQVLFEGGQVDEAIRHYQKALVIKPDDGAACNNLGNALMQKGQVDEALACFQQALKFNPYDDDYQYNIGNALYHKGRLDEAIAHYQAAIAINPIDFQSHANLGSAFYQKGSVDEAIAEFQKAVEINPGYVRAHTDLGLVFLNRGQALEAITEFQKVLQLDPNNIGAQASLAKAQALAHQQSNPK